MNTLLPTDSELEILQVLWEHGPSTVRFVNDTINRHREVGYTSTLKTMQLMMDKGMLDRSIEERVHYYSATVSESQTQKGLLDEFVHSTFRGSPSTLVMRMLGDGESSLDELQRIKSIIEAIEKNQKN